MAKNTKIIPYFSETFCKGDFVRHIFSNHDIFKSIEINELIQNFTETRLFKQYAHLNHKKHSDIRKILTPIKTTSPGKCHKKTSDDTVDVDVIASHSATSAGMHDNANSSTRASNVQSYPNLSISATNIQTPNLVIYILNLCNNFILITNDKMNAIDQYHIFIASRALLVRRAEVPLSGMFWEETNKLHDL